MAQRFSFIKFSLTCILAVDGETLAAESSDCGLLERVLANSQTVQLDQTTKERKNS